MDHVPAPPRLYAHRRADAVVLNTTLDRDAIAILSRYAPPGRRATGHFLARLLYEHDARVQARADGQTAGGAPA